MPELAAAYAIGVIASFGLSTLFVFLWTRHRARPQMKLLNANLAKADLYWSERQDRLLPLFPNTDTDDHQTARRSLVWTSLGLSFLSWIGFLFILILMVSYRFLARSRTEKLLTESMLTSQTNLSRDEVSRLMENLRQNEPHLFH